jgi:hypothetical protein
MHSVSQSVMMMKGGLFEHPGSMSLTLSARGGKRGMSSNSGPELRGRSLSVLQWAAS